MIGQEGVAIPSLRRAMSLMLVSISLDMNDYDINKKVLTKFYCKIKGMVLFNFNYIQTIEK